MPLLAPLSDICHTLNQDMMLTIVTKIHSVIHNMSMPLWFGSIPANFGDTLVGTIKADE